MSDHNKQATAPYEPLMEFVNAEITQENWRTVRASLAGPVVTRRKIMIDLTGKEREGTAADLRSTVRAPSKLRGQLILDPEPLREVQDELKKNFERLTDPAGWVSKNYVVVSDYRSLVEDIRWLYDKINRMTVERERQAFHSDGKTPVLVRQTAPMAISMRLVPDSPRIGDYRVLLTDPVLFVPEIEDLRVWVYFRLGKLCEDGLLPRIGRCQNGKCRRFFLGKISRKEHLYCSRRCAQRVTAAERVKASRARRATWTAARENLERAVENMKTLYKTTEKQALARGEEAIKKAEEAFQKAFPRKRGPKYKEGKVFLARTREQIKRLRKKVKGY